MTPEHRRLQSIDSKRRYRARKKLMSEGKPIPPELLVRSSGSQPSTAEQKRVISQKASRTHYYASHGKFKANREARKKLLRDYVNEIKASTPCADCKNKFHYVSMDFDHLDSKIKTKSVAEMVALGFSKKRVVEEIEKCELVCANCHRVRTFTRWQETKLSM